MLLYTMLYIVLAYLMLFAALTNSVCLNNASSFSFFIIFVFCQGYELSGEIALKITIIIIIIIITRQLSSMSKAHKEISRYTFTVCKCCWICEKNGYLNDLHFVNATCNNNNNRS